MRLRDLTCFMAATFPLLSASVARAQSGLSALSIAVSMPAPMDGGGMWERLMTPAETSRGIAALVVAACLALAVDRLRTTNAEARRRR